MAIGDLLAQISGEKTPTIQTKRKAEDDVFGPSSATTAKLQRVSTERRDPITKPRPTPALPTQTSAPKIPPMPSRPLAEKPVAPKRPAEVKRVVEPKPQLNLPKKLDNVLSGRISKPSASRSTASTPTSATPAKAPQKGSFAEIMARAQAAQAQMGKVGVITHKAADKEVLRKDREREKPQPLPPKSQRGGPAPAAARQSSATTSKFKLERRDTAATGSAKGPVNRKAGARDSKGPSKEPVVEKKVKRAVTATTGYTGTARPRNDNNPKKSSSRLSGGLLDQPRAPPSRHSSRYDDEDEELDDFIEYDDDEEEEPKDGRPRYNYASDESSDMEAGLDELSEEEEMAERTAIEEDRREAALEKKLKAQKEERKRMAMQQLKDRR